VFEKIEKGALRPLLPSVYDVAVSSFKKVNVGSHQSVLYRSSKYSIPRSFCFKTIYFKAVGSKLHIYGPDMKYECSHDINPCKGSINKLPEHAKEENTDWLLVCERLRSRWNCYDFQHFINGFKKENPRHLFKQLSAVEVFLEAENPARTLVAEVLAECCRCYRYQFSQFKAVYEQMSIPYTPASIASMDTVQHANLQTYQQAFLERSKN
jgi:hypothetical protein